jgi:hypothetical protein
MTGLCNMKCDKKYMKKGPTALPTEREKNVLELLLSFM